MRKMYEAGASTFTALVFCLSEMLNPGPTTPVTVFGAAPDELPTPATSTTVASASDAINERIDCLLDRFPRVLPDRTTITPRGKAAYSPARAGARGSARRPRRGHRTRPPLGRPTSALAARGARRAPGLRDSRPAREGHERPERGAQGRDRARRGVARRAARALTGADGGEPLGL